MIGCSVWRVIRSKVQQKEMVHRHGAIISKNKKIVCKGTNHDRSFCSGKIYGPSFHAEMDAVRKWESMFLKGKNIKNDEDIRKVAKKFDIYVVRLSRKDGGFCESRPCHNCTKVMKRYGFKNIYYSNDDGGFEKFRIRDPDFESDHLSTAQKRFEPFIEHKHKL